MEDHPEELASLARRLKAVEAQIAAHVQDDPIIARLLTLEGVGLVTAATMRAEIGDFDRCVLAIARSGSFDAGKQLARYCGLTPRGRQRRRSTGGLGVDQGAPRPSYGGCSLNWRTA